MDLDGLWTLADCYGYPEGDSFTHDPVFTVALPRMLDFFDVHHVKATFFIIGRDLTVDAKRQAVAEIARRGHELASHGWSHQIGLESLPDEKLSREIEETSRLIESVAGMRPLGFRAPGYAMGPRVLAACARAGIRYDGSRLPTRWAWLLRLMANRLRRRVAQSLGTPLANAPGDQYGGGGGLELEWMETTGGEAILRLPVAVMPCLRLPLHASLGIMLGAPLVRFGLGRLARRGQPVTWLLHGLDFLGGEDLAPHLPGPLADFPMFRRPLVEKMEFLNSVLTGVQHQFQPARTADWLAQFPYAG